MCSHCMRLKQNCFYADESQRRDGSPILRTSAPQPRSAATPQNDTALAERLSAVEARLAEVLSSQASLSRSLSRQGSNPASPLFEEVSTFPGNSRRAQITLPPLDIVLTAGEIYLQYCDCQPLPLFHRRSFIQSLKNRDSELLFAIIALASRFSDDFTFQSSVEEYVEASRVVVMRRVSLGKVELSTIQALCLLSLVDFTNGNTQRSSMHGTLAISLAFNSGMTSETAQTVSGFETEERRRCFWSLMLLKRLHGAGFGILDLTHKETFPWFPESTGKPNKPDPVLMVNHSQQYALERGIMSCALQLSEIWFKITRYARRRGKPAAEPPWSPQSEYAIIMAQQMESETRMPQVHRFKPAEFSKKSVEDLQSNRDYWGPWIFVQFLYHTNLCLLNHPLLSALRLRNFKSEMPEIFLQNTLDLVSSHTNWILNLIAMLDAKSFKVTDPFLAHCAAIVATIYLQESFVEEDRAEKMHNFANCLRFIRGFEEWPHVMRMAEKLERLRETVSSAYGIDPNRGLLIDLGQFWEILEYSSSSEVSGSGLTLFGPSLQLAVRPRTTEMGHTISLPQPTRVDAQDFAGSSTNLVDEQLMPPLLYSDDELAVLAESFFQRPEIDGTSVEWWNTGNL